MAHLYYNWHKCLFENKCFEIEACSGLINFSNKFLISIWSRGNYFRVRDILCVV